MDDAQTNSTDEEDNQLESGNTTPTATHPNERSSSPPNPSLPPLSTTNLARTTVHDVSIEVVVSPLSRQAGGIVTKGDKKQPQRAAFQATCIISIWRIEDTQYFTLTFTSATATTTAASARPSARVVNRTHTGPHLGKSRSSGSSSSSGRRSGSSSNYNFDLSEGYSVEGRAS